MQVKNVPRNKTITIANVYCFKQQSRCFCYRLHSKQKDLLGSIVEVEFSKKKVLGIILSIQEICVKNDNNDDKSFNKQKNNNLFLNEDGRNDKNNKKEFVFIDGEKIYVDKIKSINNVLFKNFLKDNFIEFLQKMSFYNVIDLERLLQLVIPGFWINKKRDVKSILGLKIIKNKKQITLSQIQMDIANKIYLKTGFNVSVVRGVMGSGKTYVFLEVINRILKFDKDAQVLIMVPEIVLTNQLIKVIVDFCGIEPIIWHSSVRTSKKKKYYEDIFNGDARIVISTRSGLLLPYKKLKMIVIDEEHDMSYKQNEIPVYNARDMAILRAKYEDIPVILSSATPSIETLENVLQKKYTIFNINKQFFNINPPDVLLIQNFGDNSSILSNISYEAILETKKRGEQSMIFINRRGFSRTLKCSNCGYEVICDNCDNLLSYHKKQDVLKCHYCGFTKYNYHSCEKCGCRELLPNKGIGVERVKQDIVLFAQKNNLNINTMLFSSDEISSEDDVYSITNEINKSDIDVIIGTQIMTKGHHFPRLTTIIVLDIDGVVLDGDFRVYEKMFQMLFQLSGRAGREIEGAKIYIQTMNPENIVLQNIKKHNIDEFYKQELLQRKKFSLPPFSRFVAIIVSAEDKKLAMNIAEKLSFLLKEKLIKDTIILGPTESQIHFLKRSYRYRFLIKSQKNSYVLNILNSLKKEIKNLDKKVQIKIDVDPYSFI